MSKATQQRGSDTQPDTQPIPAWRLVSTPSPLTARRPLELLIELAKHLRAVATARKLKPQSPKPGDLNCHSIDAALAAVGDGTLAKITGQSPLDANTPPIGSIVTGTPPRHYYAELRITLPTLQQFIAERLCCLPSQAGPGVSALLTEAVQLGFTSPPYAPVLNGRPGELDMIFTQPDAAAWEPHWARCRAVEFNTGLFALLRPEVVQIIVQLRYNLTKPVEKAGP